MKLLKARQYVTCQHAPLKGIKPKVTIVPVKDIMLTADYESVSYTHLTLPTNREV